MSAPGPGGGRSLGARTWPEIGAEAPVLLVPLGSTEQHGPHLPLDTDTRIAVALCDRAATAVPSPPMVVAPPVAYGASGEHAGFAGTLSIGQEALAALVIELGRSAGGDYRLVVFVNGHGGNAEALARAVATLLAEGRAVASWAPTVADGDSHAGRVETSVLLALDADLVHLDRAEAGATAPLGELMDRLRAGGLRAVTANGVLGDPTGATAEEGSGCWRPGPRSWATRWPPRWPPSPTRPADPA